MRLQNLLFAGFLSHVSAEYVINFLTTNKLPKSNTLGLETVIIDDGFQGCVPLPSGTTNWFKSDFDNQGILRYLQGFASRDCTGPGVGIAQSFWSPHFNALQPFTGSVVNSVRLTFPNSAKRTDIPDDEPLKDIPELTLGPNREILNIMPGDGSAIVRRSVNGYNLALSGDLFINRLTSGLFATWQYGNIQHGRDVEAPVFTSSADVWEQWATQISRIWSTGNPTGGINPHLDGELTDTRINNSTRRIAGWYIQLNGRHRTSDITPAILRSAIWRALEYANGNGDSWIEFDILNWNGSDNIATVKLWMLDD
ncbi:hypothetical protein NQ176_g5004 [Zarea fungicola]|uniref:Uncharacterized protein n=1 Tax=Zarea fungicola TaxID=93591 RepID=A0ACC1NBV3_9HYPO|nr:hypothetical protein NQ176_g5004 [Lecanicillium fungicola]